MHKNVNRLHLEPSESTLYLERISLWHWRSPQTCKHLPRASPNTVQHYITLIPTDLQTWETCWSLEIWHSLERNKHVISCGIFLQLHWGEVSYRSLQIQTTICPLHAWTGSTSEAKTVSVAADRPCAQSCIVLEQPDQFASSSEQTHKQAYTGKVRGIYNPPLKLRSDLWVPLI